MGRKDLDMPERLSLFMALCLKFRGFPSGPMVKKSTCKAETMGDMGLIPRLGRSPGRGHRNLLQYSCLENPMGRGPCQATVHWVAKSQTQMKQFSRHALVFYNQAFNPY